jgi:predicted nuclease with TOPRIM domain
MIDIENLRDQVKDSERTLKRVQLKFDETIRENSWLKNENERLEQENVETNESLLKLNKEHDELKDNYASVINKF